MIRRKKENKEVFDKEHSIILEFSYSQVLFLCQDTQRLDDASLLVTKETESTLVFWAVVENKFILKINTSASLVSAVMLIRLKNPDIFN